MNKSLGGYWPEIQFVIDVLTKYGIEEEICSLSDVPFAGNWDTETGDVDVGCVWSDAQLADNLAEAQNWSECLTLQSTEEQEDLINERLNVVVKECPWNWLHDSNM